MAVYTKEDVIPSLIENTTMYKNLRDGVHTTYVIEAVEGYVLHDKVLDWEAWDNELNMPMLDENGNPVMVLGYATGSCSCAANYDFITNPREFYAVPENSVPADQIFGGGDDNEHEKI